ncbi:MAG: hypothetical protein WCR20_11790, partial [Verrucomicrobiota bacterium]
MKTPVQCSPVTDFQASPAGGILIDTFNHLALLTLVLMALIWPGAGDALVAADAKLPASNSTNQPIPWSEVGTRATSEYRGEGLAVTPTDAGTVRLRCSFQKLEGEVSREGLWLTSTADPAATDRFRLVAAAVGRAGGQVAALPPQGTASSEGVRARFARPGLVEEYSVSVDGVRQDFVVAAPPVGAGHLRVELALSGARAAKAAQGARLVLDGSGRELAYHRMRVADAQDRELTARIEVLGEHRLAVVVADAGAAYPVRIDPTFSGAEWTSMGTVVGADSSIYCYTQDADGNLFLGGSFTAIGTNILFGIAKWDGTGWSALGAGLGGTVYAMAFVGTDLYAGGTFNWSGPAGTGIYLSNMGKWNGTTWSPLAGGVDGAVRALAVIGNNLYAGGDFITAGSISANHIAMWNGSAWSALGTGTGGTVKALAVVDTTLYMAGQFTSVDGVANTAYIAQWNGSVWSAVGGGVNAGVYALASYGTSLYAGGGFSRVTNSGVAVAAASVAKWNGSTWSALGGGVGTAVNALAASATDIYAGGTFATIGGGTIVNYVARWNGSSWTSLGTGMSSDVYSLYLSGTNLYAGGAFMRAGPVLANYFARWDGSAWSVFGWPTAGSGPGSTVNALLLSGSDLYVAHSGGMAGGVANTMGIAKWNGTSWSALGGGLNAAARSLAMWGANLYVGGDFTFATNSGVGLPVNRVAKWSGSAWSALSGGTDGNVQALAISAGNLYVGGNFLYVTNNGPTPVRANRIAMWNGYVWYALGKGVGGDYTAVNSLAVGGTNIYAGGSFTYATNLDSTVVNVNYLAKWNGSTWSGLGSGMNSGVYALAVDASGSKLYAGGGFTQAGGVSAGYAAQWDLATSTWSSIGSIGNTVYALAVSGTDLYLGGFFMTAGGGAANRLAKWDGTTWSSLGTGVNRWVYTLAFDSSGNLFSMSSDFWLCIF